MRRKNICNMVIVGCGVFGVTGMTQAQVTATLSEQPGAEVLAIGEMAVATTGFGTLFGDTELFSGATASAVMTLFPVVPPFDACTMDNWAILVAPFSMSFQLDERQGIVANVEISEISIVASNEFSGTIGGGIASFDRTAFFVSGVANISIPFFTVNESIPFDKPSFDVFQTSFAVIASDVALTDSSAVFTVGISIKPDEIGVIVIDLDIEIETAGTNMFGPLDEITLGDADFDTDVDLTDYGVWAGCLEAVDPPPICTIFDFNADGSLNLTDWGRLQAAFTGGFSAFSP